MGVRKSLLIGYCITFASLLAMSVTNSLSILFSCLFVFLPLGNSMGIPMLTIGIRRYTTPESRGFAYGIFYSCMNIGALLSGPVVDFFNIAYKEPVLVGGMLISGNRMVIFSCAISVCISFGTAFPFLRDVRLADPPPPVIPLFVSETHGVETVILNASPFAAEVKVNTSSSLEEFKPKQQGVLQTFRDLTRSPTFWRFSGLCLLLVNLNSIYRYLDALFPTYLIRSFGPNVPKGMLYSINPFMIILLTPLVAALFRTAKNYNMIKWGGYGTALSPLWLVASNSLWAAGLFVVTLSLGECIWAPRVYNYTMSIAPEVNFYLLMELSP